jgi:hypothetical protein
MTAAATPLPLEPAEFYYLHEGRDESEFLYNRAQVEADPEATTRLARDIARRHMAVDPDWTPYEILPTYFDLPNVAFGPDLVLAATAFAAPAPRALPHHDVVANPSEGQTSAYYDIVSADWKAAIESVEPCVHGFFPHKLRFAEGVVSDRFVFRCGTQVDEDEALYRVEDVLDVWSEITGYRFVVDGMYDVPTLDRERVAGRHFVSCPSRRANYVSRALAETLQPLLPARTALLPVRLSGAAPGVPFLSPARIDAVLKGAIAPAPAASIGGPSSGGRRPSEPPLTPSLRDPELAEAIAEINDPAGGVDPRRHGKAQSMLERRLARASVEDMFAIMAEALKSDVPLDKNFALNLSYCACHEREESALLSTCRAWAADPSPLRRVAVARVLSRQIDETERPNPETFAILTGLLDDPDPDVVARTIGIMAWMFHPAYDQALRSRRERFARHESAKVRDACRGLIDKEQEQATRTIPELPGEDVAGLFASTFAAMRSAGSDFDARLAALRLRDPGELIAVAARWAEDPNPDKRTLAALALECHSPDRAPMSGAGIDVLRKLSGDGDATVAAAAVTALAAARNRGPVGARDLAASEAARAHPSAATRAAYVESLALGQSPEALEALLGLADDPAEEVRRSVALHLRSYVADSDGKLRARLREVLAGLTSDPSKYVRYFATDALTALGDPRAVNVILRELDGPEEDLPFVYKFLLPSVLARPSKRYLPGLRRMHAKYPGDPALAEAIEACAARGWFAWVRRWLPGNA